MASILASFSDNKSAYNCMYSLKKLPSKEIKIYTLAQNEYKKDEDTTLKNKTKRSTKIGALIGILVGFIVYMSYSTHIFNYLPHIPIFIFIMLISAFSGSIIGLLATSYIRKHDRTNYHSERGELILIVENPGDNQDKIVEIIQKYNPNKLNIYN